MLQAIIILWTLVSVQGVLSIGRAPFYENGVTQNANLSKNFIVSIRSANDSKDVLCLGTIINRKLVLTAAHCVLDSQGNKKAVEIVAGTVYENYTADPKAILRNVSNIFVHPNYEQKAAANDLAVLELNQTFEFIDTNLTSAPISDRIPDYPECYLYGWGCDTNKTSKFEKLQTKIVFIYDRAKCQRRYGANFYINEVCADYFGNIFCADDTGGPLMCDNKLVAVVSFVTDQEVYPNLFMLVSRHIGFIHNPVGILQFYSAATNAHFTLKLFFCLEVIYFLFYYH